MLRTYWKKYRQPKKEERIFLSELGEPITVGAIRIHFRKYRKKAKINEKATVHTLCYPNFYKIQTFLIKAL